jgi:hypothetical protein
MAAMAGASGVRSWLQAHGFGFLTPQRLRRATIALFVVATGVSTIGLGGSTKPAHAASPATHAAHVR